MSNDEDFERILAQSINYDSNQQNARQISTSESGNILSLFVNIKTKGECLICCDDNKITIKCCQCTAIYCKECFIKIASEFNKCSTCSIDIKANYSKIKDHNEDIQKKEEARIASINAQRNTSSIAESRINRKAPSIPVRSSTPVASSSKNVSYKAHSNDNTEDLFLEDLINNKIYNIDFKSYVTNTSIPVPNFRYDWNYINKELTFYPLCNNQNDMLNITIKYDILDARFQAEFYPWILELLKNSLNIFKYKWNIIAIKVNNFTVNNENLKKKLISEIIDICKPSQA